MYFQAMVCWGAHRERPFVSVGDMFPNKFEPLNHTEIRFADSLCGCQNVCVIPKNLEALFGGSIWNCENCWNILETYRTYIPKNAFVFRWSVFFHFDPASFQPVFLAGGNSTPMVPGAISINTRNCRGYFRVHKPIYFNIFQYISTIFNIFNIFNIDIYIYIILSI